MTSSYSPRQEDITGASLTGSTGTADRKYTLNYSNSISSQLNILIEGMPLQPGVDFSFASGVITFTNLVFNDQNITLTYFTLDEYASPSGTYWANTLQIARTAGIGVEISGETLGTGDNSENSYDTANGNIIDSSYNLYYADADSNDVTALVGVDDYTINIDRGLILLTSAGITKVNEKVIYIDYTYSPKQSDTVLASYLPASQDEAEKLTGNYWGSEKTTTEYFDGLDLQYPETDEPFGIDYQPSPEWEVKYKGLISVTNVLFLNRSGVVSHTVEADYIDFDEDGRVIANNTTVPNGKRNVKIVFTHGYTTVPNLIQELVSLLGGVRALVNISGGSYKDISVYTLGRATYSRGQVYVNIKESIDQMKKRVEEITDSMGYRYSIA